MLPLRRKMARFALRLFRLNQDIVAFLVAIGILLAILARWDRAYLGLFSDIFAVTCCIVVYGFARNTAGFNASPSLRFLGPSFAFIALLEMASTMASYGPRADGQGIALFLRLSSGWYLAFAFFFLSSVERTGVKMRGAWTTYFLVTLAIAGVAALRLLPPPRGTVYFLAFALANTVFTWVLLMLSALRLRRSFPSGRYRRRLVAAVLLAAAAAPAALLSAGAAPVFEYLGEYFRIASFFLIYKAVVSQVLMKPYRSMFLDMRREGGALRKKNLVLSLALEEKMGLLREVHHRIKNSLQIIASLLDLAKGESGDAKVMGILRDSQERVRSVALVHDLLSRSPEASAVDISAYIRRLISGICGSLSPPPRIETELSEVWLPLDRALPMGMALNELLTNAAKYGGREKEAPRIRVRLAIEPDALDAQEIALEVEDDGPGFPAQFDPEATDSLGFSLIHSLASQLRGYVSWSSKDGGGLRVRFAFPEKE